MKNEFNQLVGHSMQNWKAAKMPENKSLFGCFCTLEPMDINKHAIHLFESLQKDNDGQSWTYLPYGPIETAEEFIAWIKKTNDGLDTQLYAIIDIHTNLPIGVCGYLRMTPAHGVIEIGHLHFSTFLKQKPAATEAMYLMMQYAFDHLGYRRYEWKCDSLNIPSRKAAERFGFSFEGIFRQHNVFKNRNRDTAWYSIIDGEWPTIKERFQRWLDKNNFDAQGKQIKRLQEA
jgi:RimJ/RimL family protein N-acetyltransferase